jgi:hypothetical protein
MDNLNFSFPITMIKTEQRIVCGVATADNVDKSNDIVDFAASEIAFKNWQGNIREMHAPIAVGKAISYKPLKLKGEDGQEYNAIQVEAYISKGAEATWQKVLDGTLRAFSIGGRITKKEVMEGKMHNGRPISIIKEYDLGELSLVDNPANAMATIDLVKMNNVGDLNYALDCDLDCQIEKAKQPLKDPKGGLTAAGRRHFKQTEGANLKPGVRGAANTPEKMRRKGSFLTRFFTNPSGPMKKPNGEPSRLALSAAAWGEPVPQNSSDAAALAAKGRRLLERYANTKKKSVSENDFDNSLLDSLLDIIESSGYAESIEEDFTMATDNVDNDIIDMLLDELYEEIVMEVEKSCNCEINVDKELQNLEKYDSVIPMDNSLTDNKMSFIKKFINWVGPIDNLGLEKSEQDTEASTEADVIVEQVEEQDMDIEVLKEALGSVIDQKLTDFATSFKQEVEANVDAKIEAVTKSVEDQKIELAEKLETTEKALEVQTAKVEEFAQAGAVKKSVDPEDDEDGEELVKSAPKSFWSNMYLPQELISSLGYRS